MKRKRFAEEQILAILKELEAGGIGKDVCRRHGIGEHPVPLEGEAGRRRRLSDQGVRNDEPAINCIRCPTQEP